MSERKPDFFSDKKIKKLLLRLLVYFAGIVSVCAGIVLCVRCKMGISPISSVPYVLHFIVPMSFGTLTMLFHLANSLIQYILERRLANIRIFLQVPVAVLFGIVIDIMGKLIAFDAANFAAKWAALIFSVFFTALGMVLMVNMKLVQNPPDGTVKLISSMLGKDMGKIKIVYDIICVLISLIIGFVFMRKMVGFGIATVVSAIFVGRTLSLLQRLIGNRIGSVAADRS